MRIAGTVVILAAGQGTRMRSEGPKVLRPLCGRPMLGYVLDQALALEPARIVVVVGHGGDEVRSWVRSELGDPRIAFVIQAEQNGTGHAVMVCGDELRDAPGPVVVLYGDMPLLSAPVLVALCEAQRGKAASLLTALANKARGFGRILRAQGAFRGIVEERDATPEERAIREVNVGVYAFAKDEILRLLPRLTNDNAQGEYYLTDVLRLLVEEGGAVETVTLEDEREAIGINTLSHLAEARVVIQARILEGHLEAGVHIEDPSTTVIDHGVRIGAGTEVRPCTVIRRGATVGERCLVGPFALLESGATLADGTELSGVTPAREAR